MFRVLGIYNFGLLVHCSRFVSITGEEWEQRQILLQAIMKDAEEIANQQ